MGMFSHIARNGALAVIRSVQIEPSFSFNVLNAPRAMPSTTLSKSWPRESVSLPADGRGHQCDSQSMPARFIASPSSI
jgi:hypothetical protein